MATPEDIALRVVARFVDEFWNQRRFEIADEIYAPECVTHQLRSGSVDVALPRGPEAMKKHAAEWLEGFPDIRFSIDQSFASGDLVFSRLTLEGTHTGSWHGLPPTGKKAFMRIMTVHRVAFGRIVEDWSQVETLGFLQQLGVLPSMANIFVDHIERTQGPATGVVVKAD